MCVCRCLEQQSLRTRFCAMKILQLILFSLLTLFSTVKVRGGERSEKVNQKKLTTHAVLVLRAPRWFSLVLSHTHTRTHARRYPHPSTQVGMWSRTKGRLRHNRKKSATGQRAAVPENYHSTSLCAKITVFVCQDPCRSVRGYCGSRHVSD